jgi:hypothetical protein
MLTAHSDNADQAAVAVALRATRTFRAAKRLQKIAARVILNANGRPGAGRPEAPASAFCLP